jgi:hypothetical protein
VVARLVHHASRQPGLVRRCPRCVPHWGTVSELRSQTGIQRHPLPPAVPWTNRRVHNLLYQDGPGFALWTAQDGTDVVSSRNQAATQMGSRRRRRRGGQLATSSETMIVVCVACSSSASRRTSGCSFSVQLRPLRLSRVLQSNLQRQRHRHLSELLRESGDLRRQLPTVSGRPASLAASAVGQNCQSWEQRWDARRLCQTVSPLLRSNAGPGVDTLLWTPTIVRRTR